MEVDPAELAKVAGIDPTTLSRMETSEPMMASAKNLQAVLDALRHHGVEVGDDMIRLIPRKARRDLRRSRGDL